MNTTKLSVAFLWIVGCSHPPAKPPVVAVEDTAAVITEEPPPVKEDPRVLRCGIDDRPKPVGDRDGGGVSNELALAGFGRVVAPRTPGMLVFSEEAAIDFTACVGLATPSDAGLVHLHMAFSAEGTPVSVFVDKPPTPVSRCIMTRACTLQNAPGSAELTTLAVRVEPPAPVVPPPPPPPAAVVRLEGTLPGRGDVILRAFASGCLRNVPLAKPAKLVVHIRQIALPRPFSSGGRDTAFHGATARFKTVATLKSEKDVPHGVTSCILGRLGVFGGELGPSFVATLHMTAP